MRSSRSRSSCARSPSRRSATTTCCCESGRCRSAAPTCTRRYNTQSWPVNVPVVLGHEFGGTVAKAGRAVSGFREGDRVVSETAAADLRRVPAVPHRPLQPLSARARDSATASTARWRRTSACRRAACTTFPTRCRSTSRAWPSRTRSPTTRCASTRRSGPAISSSSSVPARSACCARGWRRWPAPIR